MSPAPSRAPPHKKATDHGHFTARQAGNDCHQTISMQVQTHLVGNLVKAVSKLQIPDACN